MYSVPSTMRSSRIRNRVTPRISNGWPSVRVPAHVHSLQFRSPSCVDPMSSARRSGTPANIVPQFARTCSRPMNVRPGCTGCRLS